LGTGGECSGARAHFSFQKQRRAQSPSKEAS
jgi:hypothetical protein